MVLHIICADILLIAHIFPWSCGARKNTTQLAKYPHVLYAKLWNKVYILDYYFLIRTLGSAIYGETLEFWLCYFSSPSIYEIVIKREMCENRKRI